MLIVNKSVTVILVTTTVNWILGSVGAAVVQRDGKVSIAKVMP